MKLNDFLFSQILTEIFIELAAVVCLNMSDAKRSDCLQFLEKVPAVDGAVRFVSVSESEIAFRIDGGDNISFYSLDKLNDGIHLNQVIVFPRFVMFNP